MSDIIFILIVTCIILYILSTQLVKLYLHSLYFAMDPGLIVTVNFIFFTLREPNVYKPYGFFLGFLATVLFYRYLYFVVKEINSDSKLWLNHIFRIAFYSDLTKIKATGVTTFHQSGNQVLKITIQNLPRKRFINHPLLVAGVILCHSAVCLGDQYLISPINITALLSRRVMRI